MRHHQIASPESKKLQKQLQLSFPWKHVKLSRMINLPGAGSTLLWPCWIWWMWRLSIDLTFSSFVSPFTALIHQYADDSWHEGYFWFHIIQYSASSMQYTVQNPKLRNLQFQGPERFRAPALNVSLSATKMSSRNYNISEIRKPLHDRRTLPPYWIGWHSVLQCSGGKCQT